MTEHSTKPSLIRGFVSLTGAEVVSKIAMLLTFAYVARAVGPASFGYLEFAGAVVLCAGFLVDQGFSVYGAREVARDPHATLRLVSEITSLRALLAVAVYAGVWVFTLALDRPAAVEQLMLLYGISLFVMPWMLQWVYQGHDKMRVVAAMQLVRTAVFATGVFVLLRGPGSLWPVAAAEVAGAAAIVVMSLASFRKHIGAPFRFGFRWSTALLRAGSTIGLSQLFWALRTYGAVIVVGLIASSDHVGYFGAAMRLSIGLNMFVWLYFFNLLPSMSRTWQDGDGRDGFRTLLGQSIRTSGWLALGGGVLWFLLAPTMIELAYGHEFEPAAAVFQWLSGMCVLGVVHGNFRFGLIAADHQKFATASAGIGTVVALALTPFAYHLWGAQGPAMAVVVGEVMVWCSSFMFARRLLGLRSVIAQVIRPLVAAVLVSGLLYALPAETATSLRVGAAVAAISVLLLASEPRARAAHSTCSLARPGPTR